jgi:hypothetical protein
MIMIPPVPCHVFTCCVPSSVAGTNTVIWIDEPSGVPITSLRPSASVPQSLACAQRRRLSKASQDKC